MDILVISKNTVFKCLQIIKEDKSIIFQTPYEKEMLEWNPLLNLTGEMIDEIYQVYDGDEKLFLEKHINEKWNYICNQIRKGEIIELE